MTTPDPLTTRWVPIGGAIGVPQPVVNGQWLKGVGGVPVWSAIARADLPPVVAGDISSAVNGQFLKGVGGVGAWAQPRWSDLNVDDDSGWVSPALLNGWTQYAGWPTIGYRKRSGEVRLRGLANSTTTTWGKNIFVLPAGFRPSHGNHYPIASGSAQAVHTKVMSDGSVYPDIGGATAIATWVSLEGVTFWADG